MLLLPKYLQPVADILTLVLLLYTLHVCDGVGGSSYIYSVYSIILHVHVQVYLVFIVYLLLFKNPNTSFLKLVSIYQR